MRAPVERNDARHVIPLVHDHDIPGLLENLIRIVVHGHVGARDARLQAADAGIEKLGFVLVLVDLLAHGSDPGLHRNLSIWRVDHHRRPRLCNLDAAGIVFGRLSGAEIGGTDCTARSRPPRRTPPFADGVLGGLSEPSRFIHTGDVGISPRRPRWDVRLAGILPRRDVRNEHC